jgi:hypothetical protein
VTDQISAIAKFNINVNIDDNAELVTFTLPASLKRVPQSLVRAMHDTAGNMGYGIDIKRAA